MEELICNINTISIYKVYTAGYNVFVHLHVKNVERSGVNDITGYI